MNDVINSNWINEKEIDFIALYEDMNLRRDMVMKQRQNNLIEKDDNTKFETNQKKYRL